MTSTAHRMLPVLMDGGHGKCSGCGSSRLVDPFSLLVQDIRQYLGSSSGIDSAHIDPDFIIALMSKYTSNPKEWERYARADTSRNYPRNLVDSVNGKANLILIVWNPQEGSPIHDHADAHCIMKILKGNLKETIFHMPDSEAPANVPLSIKKETIYGPNQVAYISDKIGLHRVSNPDNTDFAMSLHLYTPPNAAEFGFNIYDEKTGKSSHCRQA